jgi:hypothetical protein
VTTPAPPRRLVTAPAFTPARYGLFAAAAIEVIPRTSPRQHELTGIEYDVYCPPGIQPYTAPCEGVPPGDKQPSPVPELTRASPFVLYAADQCPEFGFPIEEVTDRLQRGEENIAEEIIESGSLGNRPALRVDPVILDATGLDLRDAVGLLEDWIDDTFASLGVLHAARWLTPRLGDDKLLTRPDSTDEPYRDWLDNSWVLGAGYTGQPPEGTADDGTAWLYATGPVTVRRSEIIQPADMSSGALNTTTNEVFLLAERLYVVDWPCQAAAVKTTITRPGSQPAQLETDWQGAPDDPMAIGFTVKTVQG